MEKLSNHIGAVMQLDNLTICNDFFAVFELKLYWDII